MPKIMPTGVLEPTAANPTDLRSRIGYADGFRIVAIFAVVMSHFMRFIPARHGGIWIALGEWGVACFFVLSGYLLSRSYISAIVDGARWPDLKKYLFRRFLRIWPLYAVAVLFAAVAAQYFGEETFSVANIFAHLFFIQNLFLNFVNVPMFGAPLWTMPVDIDFYLLLPFAAYVMHKVALDWTRSVKIRFVTLSSISVIALCAIYRIAVLKLVPGTLIPGSSAAFSILQSIFGMSASFACGALVSVADIAHLKISRTTAIICTGLSVVFFLVGLELKDHDAVALRTIAVDIAGAFSASLLLFGCLNKALPALDRFVSCKAVAWLASLAYGIYLFHFPIAKYTYRFMMDHHQSNAIYLAAVFTLTLLAAYIGHNFVERPFLIRKDALRDAPAS